MKINGIHIDKKILELGLDLFGDIEKLTLWLSTPNFALGNIKPIDLLNDPIKKDMVIDELGRISFGIYS